MSLRTGELLASLFKKSGGYKALTESELWQLKDVMTACEENHLTCFMAYGTALGSVRHKGFIPWDDDMDFYMLRSDYMKFLEVFSHDERYYVRSVSKGDDVSIPTCHIRKKGTRYVNYGDLILMEYEPAPMRGIYIDIFPLDDAPNLPVFRFLHGAACLTLQFIASCVHVRDSVQWLKSNNVEITKQEMAELRFKFFLGTLFGVFPLSAWSKAYDRFASAFHSGKSKYLTCYTGYKSFHKSVIPRADLVPCSEGLFEGHVWKAPHNPDAYLTRTYGDYMTPPSAENQRTHPVFELDFGLEKESADVIQ